MGSDWGAIVTFCISLLVMLIPSAHTSESSDISLHASEVWSFTGVFSLASIVCLIVLLVGCALLCPRKSDARDYPADDPFPEIQFPNSAATDGFSMYPPTVNTPATPQQRLTFEPLPDVSALIHRHPQAGVRAGGNISELRPKVLHVGRERLDSEGEEEVVSGGGSDKAKLDRALSLAKRVNRSSQCSRAQLQYLRELGNGWFGKVLQAEGDSILPGHKKTHVVVQMLNEDASIQDQHAFIQEGALYRDLDHINVLKVIAYCVETMPYLTVLEICAYGDLKSYLRGQRANLELIEKQGLLLNFACDIAAGLQAMHQANYVHRDFAVRNCLVTSELSVKVGDYGLSEEMYKEDYYRDSNGVALPIRWLAPEVINVHDDIVSLRHITKDSNLWSFGVVLWELVSLGALPYSELTDQQVLTSVVRDRSVTLMQPDLRISNLDRIYQLMGLCWSAPSQRPSLRELRIMLLHLCSSKDEPDFTDFDRKWNQMLPRQVSQPVAATIDPVDITFSSPDEVLTPVLTPPPGVFHSGPTPQSLIDDFDINLDSYGVKPGKFDGGFHELNAASLLIHNSGGVKNTAYDETDWSGQPRYQQRHKRSLTNELSLEDELSAAMNSGPVNSGSVTSGGVNYHVGSAPADVNRSHHKTGTHYQQQRLLPHDQLPLSQGGVVTSPLVTSSGGEKERMLSTRQDNGNSDDHLSADNLSQAHDSGSQHSPASERDDWSMIDHTECVTSTPLAARHDNTSVNSFTCIPDSTDVTSINDDSPRALTAETNKPTDTSVNPEYAVRQ